MKTYVAGFMRCLCHHTGKVVEEEEVDTYLAELRRREGDLPAFFANGQFISGREHFTDQEAADWTEYFRKRVATALATSLDTQEHERNPTE